MDINPSKIAEMMTLLDEHQEHMPEGTRLALCNKLLECKKEERIEYELTVIYPTVKYETTTCGEYHLETEMSIPITIITSFTQSEFNIFENNMQHRKYGSVSKLQGTASLNQIVEIQVSINYEISKWIEVVRERDEGDLFPIPEIKIHEMMIVDYQRIV